jgi:light-regulated signal transduction histidine kinase (bacteriophytochrome)
MEFFKALFSSGGFQPHGFCYRWNTGLVWLNVLSDLLIALAYFAIPLILLRFIRKRSDLPFSWMFALFGVFIVACGTTHLMEVWNLWHAQYWLAGAIKAVTAAASILTAGLLVRILPQAVQLPSAQQWRKANAELTAANKELEAFSYSVSHDLRAPLRSIDGFSLALLEDYSEKLDDEGKNHLERVRVATQRMGALIDDLLNLSRVTRASIHLEKVDVSAVAAEVIEGLQKAQPERQVEIRVEQGLQATVDAHLLRIVLENLLGNAWKFTSKRALACIEFGKTSGNGRAAFFVRDDGAGFDPAYADRLFGAFQRLHSVSEFPGTGIGLATVQRIIHRHGGRIWAESSAGQGATFYFTLTNIGS